MSKRLKIKLHLLIDKSIARAPAMSFVCTWHTINSGLRVNSQKSEFVDFGQWFGDDRSF
jgi:hypothetical protein